MRRPGPSPIVTVRLGCGTDTNDQRGFQTLARPIRKVPKKMPCNLLAGEGAFCMLELAELG